jgi:AraC-like DNA-binding protein
MAVGTTFGITLLTPSNGKREELHYYPEQEKDFNNFVHTLFLNHDRELWIGTDGGGLYVYDLKTRKCRHLTTKDGLPSNYVNSIHKDVLNRIIIATERGLSFADPKNPSRIIGVNYCYGVDREYTSRCIINLDNGHMVLGSTTGALVVNPNHIQEIDYTAKLNLTGLHCDDDTDEDWKERMHRQLSDKRLKLSYGQRTFELFFEAINLRNQSDIVYQYKVDNSEWSTPSAQQFIRFTSMEPGYHKLLLKSVSRTCGAELDKVSLTIEIGQPWWNTWWMWLVYCFLLVTVFYGAWHVYQLHTKYMRLVVNNPSLNANIDVQNDVQPADSPSEQQHDEGSEFISRATTLIIDNISDSEFTIDRLCREMAMSRTLFYVKLKSYTGKSPQDFIRVIRLERAAALLRSGRPVTDAAALTGFDNPKYFSTVFKKYFGVSPSKYQ